MADDMLGRIPWQAWTVAAVEFVERFSYYGTSAVCMCQPTFRSTEWNLYINRI